MVLSAKCEPGPLSLYVLATQITIAKNFGKKARANCLASVDGNDSRSPIGMPQKMMATLYPEDRKPSFSQRRDELFAGNAGKRRHAATVTR